MEKEKVKDFLTASRNDAIQAILDSDETPEIIKNIAELVVSESTATMFGIAFGAIAPRLQSIHLSYKELRFEHHVEEALVLITDRIAVLENNFEQLEEYIQEKFRGLYVGWLLDYLYDEKQDEKVPYYVNGYINLMSNAANDDLLLLYFDTISQLTQLDIEVLALYQLGSDDDYNALCKRNGLQYDQLSMIKEKLARLGLLNSKNNEVRDNNTDLIVDYLSDLDKDNHRKKPRGVKLPKIKNPSHSETYIISALGNQYLQVMSDKE